MSNYPIFRADHVGSFLRPNYLLDAREQFTSKQITIEQLREVENSAITEIVKFQEDFGIQSVTDGEFRRTYFHLDFLQQLAGVSTEVHGTTIGDDGKERLLPPSIRVTDKIKHIKAIQLADFNYLKSQVSENSIPKVAIPSPTMLHRGGRAGIDEKAYPVLDQIFITMLQQLMQKNSNLYMMLNVAMYRWMILTSLIYVMKKCEKRPANAGMTRIYYRLNMPNLSTKSWT